MFISMLVLATIVVLTLDFRTGLLEGVSGDVSQVVGVFGGGARAVARPFENVVRSVGDLATLRNRNRQLDGENRKLRLQAETINDVVRQNQDMKNLLRLEEGSGFDGIHARVIASSLSGLERSVTINKGRRERIVPDRAVLAPDGLAGRIVWAGAATAKVLLLTDAQSSVGVRIGQSGETGLARGTGERELRLELVSRAALDQGAVRVGDTVVTSGYQGGVFPSGIPVGRVERVTLAPRGTTYTITVRPFVRFSQLDFVAVIVSSGKVLEPAPTETPGEAPAA